MRWSYSETNRTGDHIWWVSDLGKFQSHYPQWQLTYSVPRILSEIYEASAERWLWSSISLRSRTGTLLDSPPLVLGSDWLERVNAPQRYGDLDRIRNPLPAGSVASYYHVDDVWTGNGRRSRERGQGPTGEL